jgi:putative sterol carrier protein
MGVKFLSDEHMETATAVLNGSDDFVGAIANTTMGLQFNISEAPDGDIDFYLDVRDGAAAMAVGELEGADAAIKTSYDTSVQLFKGDLNTQMAFMTGKIKVAGNMAALMMNQGVINKWGETIADVDVDY